MYQALSLNGGLEAADDMCMYLARSQAPWLHKDRVGSSSLIICYCLSSVILAMQSSGPWPELHGDKL